MGGTLVRSVGLVRAKARIGLKNLAYNMRRVGLSAGPFLYYDDFCPSQDSPTKRAHFVEKLDVRLFRSVAALFMAHLSSQNTLD